LQLISSGRSSYLLVDETVGGYYRPLFTGGAAAWDLFSSAISDHVVSSKSWSRGNRVDQIGFCSVGGGGSLFVEVLARSRLQKPNLKK
jgi:hypothetical protein